ncbi:carboxypeptidase-like regulatory domain-containing protein [Flavobacterium piscisymbiosum]|uniref:Carboxypeptidase-like regulatory domain-containing protein n=1 Tax=Flavobacterium piscisymbiosum TaxID=2893753 RepID=A0ABS8MIN5_9FLAO|nr:carboxypeptidase-like regulatory domain-containing protein [Flavobacterium sp. F-30]MCC9065346.1 carboxypeptidase-like regulatory domain-containing protein [Flavobacterium sp. F-30]
MEKKGSFRFAYYSKLVSKDSLVSIHADQSTVKEVLDQLLNNHYEYKESTGFVILRYAPLELSLELEKNNIVGEYYVVSGYIVDTKTNKRVENASVYEKNALQSTLTNKEGYFELKLKNVQQTIELTVTKEKYKSITMMLLSEIKIQMGSRQTKSHYDAGDYTQIERTGIGRFFISSKQKIQSLNLGGLISQAPVQASLIPSLSTRGMMNSQISSSFSLNVLGGYTGGVRGLEIAGLYNITRMNVEALQMAGIFNTVGGSVNGVQLAGIYNNVFGDLKGLQMSGIHNSVKGSQIGLQITGIYNNVQQDSKGIQIAGIHNTVNGSQNGLQISGIYNIGNQKVRGLQIAGLFNYAKELKGIQFGLVNVTGSPSGYSLGLLNFKKDGYQKFTITRNEISDINFSIKTGDNKLYTILMAGRSERRNEEKLTSFGIGLGKNIRLGNRLAYNPEISAQYLYLGNCDYYNFLYKFDSAFTFRLFKGVAISGGPSFNIYSSQLRDKNAPDTNTSTFVQNRTERYNVIKDNGKGITGWVGWSFGLTLF